jgi:hypothetical protein
MSALTAVTGQGTGLVIVSPTSAGRPDFDARVKVNIHDAAPNTTFSVTRAIAAPHSGCANFLTPFDPVATLTTSAGGAGAVEVERGMRHGPGTTMSFDLLLRASALTDHGAANRVHDHHWEAPAYGVKRGRDTWRPGPARGASTLQPQMAAGS